MPDLLTAFALVAVVLTISALASGVVERAPLSFPIIFLGLGFLLGEKGLGLLTLGPEDSALESIAVLTLALVLFLDAVRLREGEMSGAGFVPMLSLGPGTLIIVAVVALGAHFLLGTTLVESLLLGTILASTDRWSCATWYATSASRARSGAPSPSRAARTTSWSCRSCWC